MFYENWLCFRHLAIILGSFLLSDSEDCSLLFSFFCHLTVLLRYLAYQIVSDSVMRLGIREFVVHPPFSGYVACYGLLQWQVKPRCFASEPCSLWTSIAWSHRQEIQKSVGWSWWTSENWDVPRFPKNWKVWKWGAWYFEC